MFSLLAFAWTSGFAQDIDTLVFHDNRKPFTFVDQIEDPKEKDSFLALFAEQRPARKRRLAEQFLKQYSQSWLLAPVYEIASKAAIDLGDYRAALDYGRKSLRLLPENPLLLVPLANVQVQQNLLREASQSAKDALEYLERFGRPAAIPDKEWPALERRLKASAHYALGRAAVMEGLSLSGQNKRDLLERAVPILTRASQLNSEDNEIAYLLGLTYLFLGDRERAAARFSEVSRVPGPLQAKAIEQLRKIPAYKPDAPAARQPEPPPAAGPPEQYAGSQACRDCHAKQHSAWSATGMARMFRTYRPENVIGDFSNRKLLTEESGIAARAWIEGDRHFFGTRRAGGEWERFPVDFTIGSKWQQAYATRLAGGQIHVFPLQYNKLEGAWVNYWKMIDPPGTERGDLHLFHQMSAATNYQIHCASCHTSQLQAKSAAALPESLNFREPGINCEMCHGPSARHVAAMRSGKSYAKPAISPPVEFARLDNRAYVAICAQCHMQSAMRAPGPRGEWNYLETGQRFFQPYQSRPFIEFSRKAFYKDGRFSETTFIVEAFYRSACFKKGGAHCGHCHDPHPPDAAANPASLKHRESPDQMCLQCHTRYAANPVAHTHHAAASTASRCVSCHMPRVMNSLLFQARTHEIDDIPRPDMTLRFGQQESPNACLTCHDGKDAKWAGEQLRTW